MNCLIITGGSIGADFGMRVCRQERFDFVIAADSGINFCRRAGIVPDMILGDFDSALPEDHEYYAKLCPERIRQFPVRKDGTDTELAVLAAEAEGADEITLLGATGTRLDHVLANIQVAAGALGRGVSCVITDEHNRLRLINRCFEIKRKDQFGDYISLIPFSPAVSGLTLRGFSYELEDFTLVSGNSLGISNYITGLSARITLREGILIVVESRDRAASGY